MNKDNLDEAAYQNSLDKVCCLNCDCELDEDDLDYDPYCSDCYEELEEQGFFD